METFKIIILGINNAKVENISINTDTIDDVDDKFEYGENDDYIGEIEYDISNDSNYDILIQVTGTGSDCSCNIIKTSSNPEIDYGTEKGEIDNQGGVNFILNIY